MAEVPAHIVEKELERYKKLLLEVLELNGSLTKLLEEKSAEKLIPLYERYVKGTLWILKRVDFSAVEGIEEYKADLIAAADKLSNYLSLSTEERQGKEECYRELLESYLVGSKLLIESVSWLGNKGDNAVSKEKQ